MTIRVPGFAIGGCGRACSACRWTDRKICKGCPAENLLFEPDERCVIYECAKRKGVAHCLVCEEMPCDLRKKTTGGYCPVYAKHKAEFDEYVSKKKEAEGAWTSSRKSGAP